MQTWYQLRVMKISERRKPPYQSISLIVLVTGLCAHGCFFPSHLRIFKIWVSLSLCIQAIVKSVVIGIPIRLPPWVMLTPSLSRNAPAISSLTMPVAASRKPPSLGSKDVGACVPLYCPLAHGFGFCCALMLALDTPNWALNLSGLLGARVIP
jgi:hypothetical protein